MPLEQEEALFSTISAGSGHKKKQLYPINGTGASTPGWVLHPEEPVAGDSGPLSVPCSDGYLYSQSKRLQPEVSLSWALGLAMPAPTSAETSLLEAGRTGI